MPGGRTSPRWFTPTAAAVGVMLAACSSSHGGDGRTAGDGGPPRDAGRGDAGQPPDAGRDAGPPPSVRAFDVTARFAHDPGPGIDLSVPFAASLAVVDGDAEGSRVVLSRAGEVSGGRLEVASAGERRLAAGQTVSLLLAPVRGCEGAVAPTFDSLAITLIDDDGDGAPERLTGTGAGRTDVLSGDVIFTTYFDAELEGEVDATPPDLALLGFTGGAHPVDAPVVRAGEALDPGVTLALVAGDGARVPLVPVAPLGEPEAVFGHARFTVPVGAALAFGAAYTLVAEPALVDLAGIRVEAASYGALRTLPHPGRVTGTLDFESDAATPPPGLVLGPEGAELVSADGPFTPPEGAHALLLRPDGRATVVLTVAATLPADRVRFDYRLLSSWAGGFPMFTAVVRRPGGAAPGTDATFPTPRAFTETGDAAFGWESEALTATIELDRSVGPGEELVLDVRMPPSVRCGLVPQAMPALFDAFRLE